MIFDLVNLNNLIDKVVAVDALDCGTVSDDDKDDLEKCFNMFKVMALYITGKIAKLETENSGKCMEISEENINIPRYLCTLCRRNFATEDSLESHKSYSHGHNLGLNVGNEEQIDKSEEYEVVVEQIYENWSTKPNDANADLVVKKVSDDRDNTPENFEESVMVKEEPKQKGSLFQLSDSLLIKRSRGRPKKGVIPLPRDPSKVIRFNPKWVNPDKWVKFVDQNGDRMCWYIREMKDNPSVAFCTVCDAEIRIDNTGVNGIKLHAVSKKHKKNIEPIRETFNPGFRRNWFM